MIINFSANPYIIKNISTVNINLSNSETNFPLMIIDRDSYIVSSEIQSGINFDNERIGHNLQIGKFCSFADKIKFMIGLNHDYKHITTSACAFLKDIYIQPMLRQKNQIIVQNDVWVGSGATIMSGVTIHNGAIVGCNSTVAKDVPPYAIVAGNPAKIIKYRFSNEQIEKLLKISWWNWNIEKLNRNKMFFTKNVDEFIDAFYENSLSEEVPALNYKKVKPVYLFFPDIDDKYSLTEHVIKNYCDKFGKSNKVELLMYLNDSPDVDRLVNKLNIIMKKLNCEENQNIRLIIDRLIDEKPLFKIADFYITSRAKETVLRTCYADEFGVKILSGVDRPVFNS